MFLYKNTQTLKCFYGLAEKPGKTPLLAGKTAAFLVKRGSVPVSLAGLPGRVRRRPCRKGKAPQLP
jgi:hypothetical protein